MCKQRSGGKIIESERESFSTWKLYIFKVDDLIKLVLEISSVNRQGEFGADVCFSLSSRAANLPASIQILESRFSNPDT